MSAVAVELDALGDVRALWRAWLADAARRYRVEGLEHAAAEPAQAPAELDARLGNWRTLLERFAEEHAPVYLRPRADVGAALRRLQAEGVRLGAFTDAPEPLARVAVNQLGIGRRLEALEAGAGAVDRLRERIGAEARVVRSAQELVQAAE